MRVVVVGSEYWLDEEKIRNEMSMLPVFTTVLHRGTSGADTIAGRVAEELKMKVEVWKIDSEHPNHSEVAARNHEMMKSDIDLCLAFPFNESKGTWDCIRRARSARIETIIVDKQGDDV